MSTEHKLKSFRKSLGREFLNWENTFIRLARVCGGIFLVKGDMERSRFLVVGEGITPGLVLLGCIKKGG